MHWKIYDKEGNCGITKEQNKRHGENKVTDINPTLSVIIWKVNGLNSK